MDRSTTRLAAALLSATLLAGLTVSSSVARPAAPGPDLGVPGDGRGFGLAAVREATQRFSDVDQAIAAGYALPPAPAPLHECISSFDGTGAMGFHYINGNLLDTKLDLRKPEALVYAPDQDGTLHLVALEYVVFQAPWIAKYGANMPTLFHQMFMSTAEPNRYEIPAFFSLHLWLYRNNPSGLFAPFNSAVSCDPNTAAARPQQRPDAALAASVTFACAIYRRSTGPSSL
jgi:hypothetical protein